MSRFRLCVNCKRPIRPGDRFDMIVLEWTSCRGERVRTTVVRCSTGDDRPGCSDRSWLLEQNAAVDTKRASG